MTNNNSNNQKPNYNESRYNKDYYSQNSYNENQNQNEYVPQSYGMSNRYDDLYDYEEESGSKDFLIGVLVGGIIGAATALFLAPKSGKELISDINTRTNELKEKSKEYTDSSSDAAGGFAQQVKEQSNKVVDKVKNLKNEQSPMDDGTASSEGEESIEMLDTVQSGIESTEKKGQEAFTSTANALKEAVEEVKEEKKSQSNGKKTGPNTGSNNNSKN
jgi:gas vesicle protein